MQAANDTAHPLVATLLESMEVWVPGSSRATESDYLFDPIATDMSISLNRFEMKEIKLSVSDVGGLVRDQNGRAMNVAIKWNWDNEGYQGLFNDLLTHLLNPQPMHATVAIV